MNRRTQCRMKKGETENAVRCEPEVLQIVEKNYKGQRLKPNRIRRLYQICMGLPS